MPILSSLKSRFLGKNAVPAAPVPVAGAELLANGNMETGDPPTGWNVAGGTPTRVADTRTGGAGTYALAITSTVEGGYSDPNMAHAANTYVLLIGWAKKVTSSARLGFWTHGESVIYTQTITALTWTQIIMVQRLPLLARVALQAFQVVGGEARFDDFSAVPLTLSSLFSTKLYASADCDLSAAITRTAGTQAGFAARVDNPANPQNFIISYLDGTGSLKTDKCLAGVYTNIAGCSGAITYVAGQRPRIVCAGNDVSVYYNGVQIGSTTAVADAGIVGNKNHGLFSTYGTNTFTGYTAA